MKLARLLLPFGLLIASLSGIFFVHATCTPSDVGTAGNDTITCDVANQPAADVEGGAGDDVIIIDSGVVTTNNIVGEGNTVGTGNDTIINNGDVSFISGDTDLGSNTGNDIIVNNGNATAILGDGSGATINSSDTIANNGTVTFIFGDDPNTGGNADDVIVNNGSVTAIVGDGFNAPSSGNDNIVNNGSALVIYGDGDAPSSGNDTIINNGTINAISADDVFGNGSGNDTITNTGIVTGVIAAGGGNDTVIIQPNTAQVAGTIDGGAGYDVLTFNLTSASPAEIQSWAEQIAAANPAGGTITLAGHTYTWANFEELSQLLFSLARLNGIMDPLAIYCSLNGGVDVYTVLNNEGFFSLNVSAQVISNAITYAQTTGSITLIGSSATASVSATPTGSLQVSDASGFSFTFAYSNYCGSLPAAQPYTGVAQQPEEELPPFSIINQPYSG